MVVGVWLSNFLMPGSVLGVCKILSINRWPSLFSFHKECVARVCVCVCELRLARGVVLSNHSSLSALCIMVWTKLSETEMALAKKWHLEENLSAVQVAKRSGPSPQHYQSLGD